jgi:hypothetical protein
MTMRILSIAIAVLAALSTPAALASDDCQVPREAWKPHELAVQAAADFGWRVDTIEADDGCWEIRGIDAQGQRIKAQLDPASLQLVALRRTGGEHDRHDKRPRAPAAPPTAPPDNPLFQSGTPPVMRMN